MDESKKSKIEKIVSENKKGNNTDVLLDITEEKPYNKNIRVPTDSVKLPADVYELYNYLAKNEGLNMDFNKFLAESARTYARINKGVQLGVLKTKTDEGSEETKYVVEKIETKKEKVNNIVSEKSKELVLAEAISGLNGAIFMYLLLLKENPKNNQIINTIYDLLDSINKLIISYATLIRGA